MSASKVRLVLNQADTCKMKSGSYRREVKQFTQFSAFNFKHRVLGLPHLLTAGKLHGVGGELLMHLHPDLSTGPDLIDI